MLITGDNYNHDVLYKGHRDLNLYLKSILRNIYFN